jgi:hypothetical protein
VVKTNLPRVEFRYSWQFDQDHKLRYTDPLYPNGDEIRSYLDHVRESWKPLKRKILKTIHKMSGLPWKEEQVVCYVVGRGVPMSDPLTLPCYKDKPDLFVEKLIYMLCERHLLHNKSLEARSVFWEAMFRNLREDGVKVSYMIPVNALFKEIMSTKLNSMIDRDESLLTTNLDYRRAWELLDKIGHRKVLEAFRRGIWEF